MTRTFIGLGSNLGDRLGILRAAVNALERIPQTSVVACSSIYETEPVGKKDQPLFLNMVAELTTGLQAGELLNRLKQLETDLGRTGRIRWGPREIDLDLLYYGDCVCAEEGMHIPHREIPRRRFVLVPLAEIDPEFVDPRERAAVRELLEHCPDGSSVTRTTFPLLFHPSES